MIQAFENPTLPLIRRLRLAATAAILVLLLGACATASPPRFPEPLRAPKPEPAAEQLPGADAEARSRPQVESGPAVGSAPVRTVDRRELPPMPRSEPVTLTLDGVSLGAFINEVFGTVLGFSLDIDQSVRSRQELVSLRLVEPEPPHRVYVIAEEVLKRYQVRIEEDQGVLRFLPGGEESAEPPRLITARALPEVPSGERPVFVAMPLDVSEPGRVAAQVRALFGNGSQVSLTEMIEANALLISGPPASVQAAMEAVALLDRVSLRNKKSLRINPLYLGAGVLAEELTAVLTAQGYSVRQGATGSGVLTFVPVASANALIVFSESDQALEAVREWVERIDQPSDEDAGDGGVYLYSARHTTVDSLLPVLEALLGGSSAGRGQQTAARNEPSTNGRTPRPEGGTGSRLGGRTQAQASVISTEAGQLAVDPVRNVIVFQGEAQRWRAIQGVLARLDQPARQVVIEVTIAEVTLTDEFEHGVEWAIRNVGLSNFGGSLNFNEGSEPNSSGVVWTPISSSGQVRAMINLFAEDSRVSILSTPRLMVKSGESASIDVGTEVPIITSQATAPDLPTTGGASILQQVQYRKTGVLLEINAIVHSGQRVDLQVAQEVSEATQTNTSDISSPSIFSRRLETSLSLQDGESMLLGGLISSSTTEGRNKVPGLGDIPVLGKLFQSARNTENRTELLMLITPYVIEDASQARAITDAVRARFEDGEP